MNMEFLCDGAFWVYLILIAVSGYGSAIFLWWWKRVGDVSILYALVSFLLLSICFHNVMDLTARYLHFVDFPAYSDLIHTAAWKFRKLPQLVAVSVLVVEITKRVRSNVHRTR